MEDMGLTIAFIDLIISIPALSILVACWILGSVLKESRIKNLYIPWIIIFFGTGLGFMFMGMDKESALFGFIIGGVSIVFYDLFKKYFKGIVKKITYDTDSKAENTKIHYTKENTPKL